MVATVAAVAAVAELLRFYPVPGVQPPTPPNTGADAAVIAASEFAIAASTFLGASLRRQSSFATPKQPRKGGDACLPYRARSAP
jgi:hypothetical protein